MKLSGKIYTLNKGWMRNLFSYVSTVLLLFWLTVLTAYGQATYADMWLDNSNGGISVIGRGASEINYTDEDGVEVEVRITSPNGRTVRTGAFGEVSVQADARLSFDWEEFGDFSIRVERFPMCYNGGGWTGDDGIMMTHGYNGTSGTLWWRPTGFTRCVRNSNILAFTATIISHAYQRELPSGEYVPTCCSACSIVPRYRPVGVNSPYLQCASFYYYNREIPCSAGLCDTNRLTPGRCHPDTGRQPPFCQ